MLGWLLEANDMLLLMKWIKVRGSFISAARNGGGGGRGGENERHLKNECRPIDRLKMSGVMINQPNY